MRETAAINDGLKPDLISANLNTRRIGRKILVYKCTASTNDVAAEYAKNRNNDGLAVFAEEQTAGRGRSGAKWQAAKGESILCSIVLTGCGISGELLSLTSAVVTAESLDKLGGRQAKIKWPNDIILNNRKVAGILVESKQSRGRVGYIIGIGINCHQKKDSFPPELQSTATSLDIESSTVCDRIVIAKRLLSSLEKWLDIAEKDTRKIVEQWLKLSIQMGQRVTVVFNKKKFSGNCIGIDPEKGLILQLDSGSVRMFDAAHTSIAK